MFDRPDAVLPRAILVYWTEHLDVAAISEFRELAHSAGAFLAGELSIRSVRPDPRYLMGTGKLEELKSLVSSVKANIILVNRDLTPSQERNIEKELSVRVVDRTGLILDIFAQRARTFEGKLQVELAQLKHLSTRLVRGWSHLERQKGGIGLRGPGETQLETDRRLLANRIKIIQRKLEKVDKQRMLGRQSRKKTGTPVIGIVGYTNAGKSTLFNVLTKSDIFAADQLFATLDPTLRKFWIDSQLSAVLADTVGFIKEIPHELVAAFRSTLQEASEADLLLHVVDATDENTEQIIQYVDKVLNDIGAGNVPKILVFNKIDLLTAACARVERSESGQVRRVWLSAATQDGIDLLRSAVAGHILDSIQVRLHLNVSQAKVRARLFAAAEILSDEPDGDGGWIMAVRIARRERHLIEGLVLA